MSSKNKTQQELDRDEKIRIHNKNNAKNPENFRKLRRRRHGVGKHRK